MKTTQVAEYIPSVTIDEIKSAIPSRKNAVTEEVVEIINKSLTEPEFQGESLLQTATTYERIVAGRSGVSLKDYLYAIKFCAYMVSMDDNYTEAYKKTFYHRPFVQERLDEPTNSSKYNELTKAASRYRASKLVVDLLTYSQIPFDMMFTGARYKAIGVLADEMINAKFSKDRINAAKELLAATKGPEKLKIALDVGVTESTAIDRLNEQMAVIAARQRNLLENNAASLEEFGGLVIEHDDTLEE